MKIIFFPRTFLSISAVVLAAMWPLYAFMGFLAERAVYSGVEAGNGLIEDLSMRPLLAVTMLLGMTLGLLSFPLSLVAIFKKGERSVLSILATLLGLFLFILLVGELFVQH